MKHTIQALINICVTICSVDYKILIIFHNGSKFPLYILIMRGVFADHIYNYICGLYHTLRIIVPCMSKYPSLFPFFLFMRRFVDLPNLSAMVPLILSTTSLVSLSYMIKTFILSALWSFLT